MKNRSNLRHPHKKRTGKQGFTLVEVAIASIVSIIGLGAAMSTGIWQMQATSFNERSSEAMAAGQEQLENFIETDYANIVNGTATSGSFNLSWTVTVTNRCKTVDLTVSWPIGRGTQQVRLHDLFPDNLVSGYTITQ